ncbi:MAG: hypothetical protein FD129_554 [bacterium]|nr:MAG: hypothetical protein FD129_554 [bacterium]
MAWMNLAATGGRRLVMIEDDEIDAGIARRQRRLDRRDAAIDADDEARTPFGGGGEAGRADPVAVAHPVRQEVADLPPHHAQHAHQEGGADHPVDIVVAVDQDRFPGIDGAPGSFGGGGHVGKLERVVEGFQAGIKVLVDVGFRRQSATEEHAGPDLWQAKGPGDGIKVEGRRRGGHDPLPLEPLDSHWRLRPDCTFPNLG